MTSSQMTHSITHSADGTPIAYEPYGTGPVVVVVGGAFNDRNAVRELAQAVATHGLTGVAYDRRGRGDSGDTKPYAVQREIEDLTAVIEAAGDGAAATQPAHAYGDLLRRSARPRGHCRRRPCRNRLGPRGRPTSVEACPAVPDATSGRSRSFEATGDREGHPPLLQHPRRRHPRGDGRRACAARRCGSRCSP